MNDKMHPIAVVGELTMTEAGINENTAQVNRNYSDHFFFSSLFIYFERKRDREHAQVGEGRRERKRENPKQAPRCQHRT